MQSSSLILFKDFWLVDYSKFFRAADRVDLKENSTRMRL